MFPKLTNLKDVLPVIEDKKEFVHLEREGYSVIDYICNFPKTFPSAEEDPNWSIYRECRGLIFDTEGTLISRPLRKFFNYGEKPEEHSGLAWATSLVQEKLDGSMVRPLWLGGWRMATRKGITDVAMQAEEFLAKSEFQKEYTALFNTCKAYGLTPVFEWCSRQNRIVVDHPEDRLVLLALRNIYDGQYLPVGMFSDTYTNVPYVKSEVFQSALATDTFIQQIRDLTEGEGVVISFPCGEKVKVKSDAYCLLHRTKSLFDSEKNIVEGILGQTIDDVYPLLTVPQKCRLDKYISDFWSGFRETLDELDLLIEKAQPYFEANDKKAYAVEFVLKQDPKYKSILFSQWEAKKASTFNNLKSMIKYSSQAHLDASRWIFKAVWC